MTEAQKMNKLIKLSLDRVEELAQEAFSAHQDCVRCKVAKDSLEETKNKIKKTEDSVRCEQTLKMQRKWIRAIRDMYDD